MSRQYKKVVKRARRKRYLARVRTQLKGKIKKGAGRSR